MDQIIHSLLETDMYKLSMGQAIYHHFSDYKTTWSFKCRNKDVHFTPEMVEEIRKQLHFTTLRFHRLDDLVESIGIEPCKLCTYCWNGKG